MIEVTIKSRRGNLFVRIQAETIKQAFALAARAAEAFDCDSCCHLCGSTEIRPRARTHDGNDFYEWYCEACGGMLSLGQHKTGGTLFPKRDRGTDGWHQYQQLPAGADGPKQEQK